MGFFKKKVRIKSEAFIADRAHDAVTQKLSDLRELIEASKTAISDELELTIFAASIPILAMSLARLDGNIVRGYTTQIDRFITDSIDKNAGSHFRARTLEYLSAFDRDIAEQKAHILPSTISTALNTVVGKSDKSVVILRMGLVKFLVPMLKQEVEFFKRLKID